MRSIHRFSMRVSLVAVAAVLFSNHLAAEMKFASEEVAATAKTPKVAEALAARIKLDEAFAAQNAEAVGELAADDLIVNTPADRVARKQAVLGFLKAGRINYEEAETKVEALDLRENQLVIMGEEVVKPKPGTDNAGKTVKRRFTDVWRKDSDGKWRLTIRQATIRSVE